LSPFSSANRAIPVSPTIDPSLRYAGLGGERLDAAQRYSQIAPAAPHAQHMPSHIFTRVGYWKESIGSNTEAARAAKASNEGHDQLHAMDYLVYAYLQTGQDAKAQAVIEEMRAISGLHRGRFIAGPYALAVSPARYAIEARRLNAAAQLAVRPGPSAQVEAMTHFARAFGAAGRASRTPPKPISPNSPNFATSCVRLRTLIGPSRSTSSRKSQPRGCSMGR